MSWQRDTARWFLFWGIVWLMILHVYAMSEIVRKAEKPPPARKQPSLDEHVDTLAIFLAKLETIAPTEGLHEALDRVRRATKDGIELHREAEIYFTRMGETAHSVEYYKVIIRQNVTAVLNNLQRTMSAMKKTHQREGYDIPLTFGDSHSFMADSRSKNDEDEAQTREVWYKISALVKKAKALIALGANADHVVSRQVNLQPEKYPQFSTTTLSRKGTSVNPSEYEKFKTHFSRTKRFSVDPFTLTILAAGAAIGYLIWLTTKEVANLRQELLENQRRLAESMQDGFEAVQKFGHGQFELTTVTEQLVDFMDDYYSGHQISKRADLIWQIAHERITEFEDTLMAATSGKLNPAALLNIRLPELLTDLWSKAREKNMEPAIKFGADLMQASTSYIFTDYGYDLVSLIPMFRRESVMMVYRFAGLPIPLQDGQHLRFRPGGYEYLAVDEQSTRFRAMTTATFTECRKIGHFVNCDLGNVARKAPPATADYTWEGHDDEVCLLALFARRFHLAVRACEVTRSEGEATVVQVGPNSFATYSPRSHHGKVKCTGNQRPHQGFTVSKLTEVNLEAGCEAETETHFFAASDSAFSRDMADWTVAYEWPLPTEELLESVRTDKFHEMHKRIDKVLNETLQANKQVDRAWWKAQNFLDKPKDDAHSLFNKWAPIALLVAVVLVTMGLIYAFCDLKKVKAQAKMYWSRMPMGTSAQARQRPVHETELQPLAVMETPMATAPTFQPALIDNYPRPSEVVLRTLVEREIAKRQ